MVLTEGVYSTECHQKTIHEYDVMVLTEVVYSTECHQKTIHEYDMSRS